MSLGNSIKKGWMWIVGTVATVGGAVWGVIAWIGASSAGPAIVTTTTAAAFVFSFADKGWIDQFQDPADEAFALVDRSKPDEAVKVLDEIADRIDTYAQFVKDGTTEGDDLEQAASYAARADTSWTIVRHTVDYQTTGDREQWIGQVSGLLKDASEAEAATKHALKLVESRVNEKDLIALMQAGLPMDAKGVVVEEIIARRKQSEKTPTSEDARFLEDLLLDVYELPQGARVVSEYVKAQDALGESDAANGVLETMLQLAPDSKTGVAAMRARLRDPEESYETIVRLYRTYPHSQTSEAIQPRYIKALIHSGQVTEAILELLGEEQWANRHDSPANVAEQVYTRANTLIMANPGVSGNNQSVVDICVVIAERIHIDGETKFPAALLIEVLEQGNALPVNQMARQPIRSATLLGDIDKQEEASQVINFLRGLVYIHQSQWDDARELLELVVQDEHASPMTKAHAMVALAQGYEADGDFDSAIAQIKNASSTLPNSIMLRDSARDYEGRREQAMMLARLERQIGQIRLQAEAATTPQQSIAHYKSMAELYLASGYGEQAVGVLTKASEEYGNDPGAPGLLRQAIQVLQDFKLKNFEARVRALELRLKREYSDFEE